MSSYGPVNEDGTMEMPDGPDSRWASFTAYNASLGGAGDGIGAWELWDILKDYNGTVKMIIESCHSGGFATGITGGKQEDIQWAVRGAEEPMDIAKMFGEQLMKLFSVQSRDVKFNHPINLQLLMATEFPEGNALYEPGSRGYFSSSVFTAYNFARTKYLTRTEDGKLHTNWKKPYDTGTVLYNGTHRIAGKKVNDVRTREYMEDVVYQVMVNTSLNNMKSIGSTPAYMQLGMDFIDKMVWC